MDNTNEQLKTKDQLIKTIKEWVKIDNEIRALKKEVASREKEKKEISKNLMDVMRKNEIDCFDLKDGQITYTKKNVKKAITKKSLLDILSKYCQGDSIKAIEINNFIMDNREEVVKESIVRTINKSTDDL
jgi:seryl-tRNA synthetase